MGIFSNRKNYDIYNNQNMINQNYNPNQMYMNNNPNYIDSHDTIDYQQKIVNNLPLNNGRILPRDKNDYFARPNYMDQNLYNPNQMAVNYYNNPNQFNNPYPINNYNDINFNNNQYPVPTPYDPNYNRIPNYPMQYNGLNGYDPYKVNGQYMNNNEYLYDKNVYSRTMKNSRLIPFQISREINFETFRLLALFLVGSAGIIAFSIFLRAWVVIGDTDKVWAGFDKDTRMNPFLSIFSLVVSVALFLISTLDYSFLRANIFKYKNDLMMGYESIPYFITRNYRNLIKRGIVVNWLAFNIYIFGAIVLGILYGMQQHKGENFLWFTKWKIKDLSLEITLNIVILSLTFATHILNTLFSKIRKNNIISYYGVEILSQREISEIKRKTNKICMIIFFVFIGILLFLIIVPILIFRNKKGSVVPSVARMIR